MNGTCIFDFLVKITDINGVVPTAPNVILSPNVIGKISERQNNTYLFSIHWEEIVLGETRFTIKVEDDPEIVLEIFTCEPIPNLQNSNIQINMLGTLTSRYWVSQATFSNLQRKVHPQSLTLQSSLPFQCQYTIYQLKSMFIYCTFPVNTNVTDLPISVTIVLSTYLSLYTIEYKFPYMKTSSDLAKSYYIFYPFSNQLPTNVLYQQYEVSDNSLPPVFRLTGNGEINSNFMYVYDNPLTIFGLFGYHPNISFEYGYCFVNSGQFFLETDRTFADLILVNSPIFAYDGEVSSNVINLDGKYNYQVQSPYTYYAIRFNQIRKSFSLPLPYGFGADISLLQYQFSNSFIVSTFFGSQIEISTGDIIDIPSTAMKEDVDPPSVNGLTLIPLPDLSLLVRINFYDETSGLYSIKCSLFELKYWDLSVGDLNQGTLEKVFQLGYDTLFELPLLTLTACDQAGNCAAKELELNKYPTFPEYKSLVTPSTIPTIEYMFFSENAITLPALGKNIVLYIKFTDSSNSAMTSLFFTPIYDNVAKRSDVVKAKFDRVNQVFYFNIHLPGGLFTGPLQYSITYPPLNLTNIELYSFVGSNATLSIQQSSVDRMPPIITQLDPISRYDSTKAKVIIGFLAYILESGSGIAQYTFHLQNENDYQPYIITSPKSKIQTPSDISISINPTFGCYGKFYITYIELVDKNGAVSIYNRSENSLVYINPLYQLDYDVPLGVECPSDYNQPVQSPSPVLKEFTVNPTTIDISSNNRTFVVDFKVESANIKPISTRHIPKCYVTALNGDILSFNAVPATNTQVTELTYSCNCTLPYGFGLMVPEGKVIITIHGVASELYGFAGYTSKQITSMGFNNQVAIQFNSQEPVIEAVSPVPFNQSAVITIFGRKLTNPAKVNLSSGNGYMSPISMSPSALIVTISPQTISPLSISVFNSFNLTSNYFDVYLVNEQFPTIPPQSPTPTPVACPGTPPCGGSSNGDCVNSICICKNEWRGNDCLSRTVINPEPFINTTNPTIDNGFNTTSPDGDDVQLNALIAIVALQEFSFNSTLLHHYPLVNWTFTNITSQVNSAIYNEYLYETTINPITSVYNTSIKVYIQWFKQEYTVEFANQQLVMYPSTLKYRIELSPYQFESELNHLEVIFSASFENDKEDSCAIKESGSTTSESDFLKLQLNSHSLYGRFIKRAVIDGRTREIGNKFNEDSTNTGSTTKLTESVSIIIPHYTNSVSMDPDFSLLLDSNTAVDKEGSCNSSNSKRKLTKNQLIGIIIGSVVGGIIFLTLITYIILKNSRNEKAIKIAMKMRSLGGKKNNH
ncbi:hypothetical protein DLAC_11471 [Tieghemostelium lacteum]|uniref:EGF-like domain-containing protein n=1 Tax=Tieghemostelium lacteum TaxID=361077 RepID=A0A152A876_TIELA|nr:hypothetical protein DLAC_11471 [Tieghemostelium lacteum]|eukprot:KYR02439.1 hypothetical protein DLAC_11471 [Tieghemostelium lacteum]